MILTQSSPSLSLRYRDIDLSFMRNPITGDIPLKTGVDAVTQSVMNLVSLGFYEKPFHPEIHCSVRQQLFENQTPLAAQHIRASIIEVIQNHEDRVQIVDVTVTPSIQNDMNGYYINVTFFVLGSTTPTNISLFLQRF